MKWFLFEMAAGLVKKFYQRARVSGDGLGVMLDGRALKTPGGAVFAAPTRALAEAVAAEWDAQGEQVVPGAMPLTQLAFAALDLTPNQRDPIVALAAKYLGTDLLRHRAEAPAALVARQAAIWDPLIAWASERFHTTIPVVTGVMPAETPPWLATTFAWEVDDLDDFRATALARAVTLSGSAILGFALLEGRLDAQAAFAAAALDNLWSQEHWGEDAEVSAGLDQLKRDLSAVASFIEVLSA